MALLKTPSDIEVMAEAGKRLAGVLHSLASHVGAGISTQALDAMSARLIEEAGAKPAFLGYRASSSDAPYPATLCTSVNDGVVHGIPSAYVIRDGDLVKLDLGLLYNGFYVDSAVTVGVGTISKEAEQLMSATRQALHIGIREARIGNTVGDIGYAVQQYIEERGFSVVRKLCGHGIGKKLHEEPSVPNFGKRGSGEELTEGMVIAIEPMVNMGGYDIKQLPDGSFVTKDGSLSAHFEHTVAITKRGSRILTRI